MTSLFPCAYCNWWSFSLFLAYHSFPHYFTRSTALSLFLSDFIFSLNMVYEYTSSLTPPIHWRSLYAPKNKPIPKYWKFYIYMRNYNIRTTSVNIFIIQQMRERYDWNVITFSKAVIFPTYLLQIVDLMVPTLKHKLNQFDFKGKVLFILNP